MRNLRQSYHRFLSKNRNKGISNLMLWVCIANAIVFVMQHLFQIQIVSLLIFSTEDIMHGEVWRLFTYIFTFASMSSSLFGPLLSALISIMFYYWIGKVLEGVMGSLRFNLFYLSGILLTDLYFLLVFWFFDIPYIADAHYLNLSMFLAVATMLPEERLYIYFFIPVKMKWLAWFDLALCLYGTISFLIDFVPLFSIIPTSYAVGLSLIALSPWVSFVNYSIFFGTRVKNLFPKLRSTYRARKRQQEFKQAQYQAPNPDWAKNYRSASGERPYRHKCTVCGRTDTSCPGLEFRYCSRCKGYFCYCIDHINNHSHVE